MIIADFVSTDKLNNEHTSNITLKEIATGAGINPQIKNEDDKLLTTSGMVYLHPTKKAHGVVSIKRKGFEIFARPVPFHIVESNISEYGRSKSRKKAADSIPSA